MTWMWIDRTTGIEVDETYDLTFSYDTNGVVKEFRYDPILDEESDSFKWIEDQFPGQSVEIMKDDAHPEIDISMLGNWTTVVSSDKFVFHEIEGQHIEIDRRGNDFYEHFVGDDCLHKFQTIGEQGTDNKYKWLSTSTDKTPFYRLCKPAGALDISDDGSLLAFGKGKDLELWSSDRGEVRSRTASKLLITDLNFGPDNKFLVSIGTKLNFNLFTADRDNSHHSSVVDIWSLPWLENVASIERKIHVQDIAISNDGKILGLASSTHVE
jgi:WD40 repeat protein